MDAGERCRAESLGHSAAESADEYCSRCLVKKDVAVRYVAVEKCQGHVIPSGRIENDRSGERVERQQKEKAGDENRQDSQEFGLLASHVR